MVASLLIAWTACTAGAAVARNPAAVRDPAAQQPAARPAAAAESGAWPLATLEFGGLAGYARGKVYDPQRTPTSFVEALARFAFHFGATGSGAMRGNFSIAAEGVGLWMDQEPAAAGGGLNLLLRYTWAAGRWRPVLLGGAGVLYSDEQIPPGETKRNFMPQAGIGLQYLIAGHVAVGGEYRFHHISNKGATETNPGINSHLILFGVSWFR